MQLFGVSRFTVRAALDALAADGLIKRYRRRGTFVTARPEGAATWMVTSLDDLVFSGFPTPPTLLRVTAGECSSDASRPLGLDEGAGALSIQVLRKTEVGPYAYSVIHIPTTLAERLPADWQLRLEREPFVGLVADANATVVHKAVQVARAIAAAGEVATLLDVPEGMPLLMLERTFFARDGLALEHAQIFCRPDRYRQIIEFRSTTAEVREAS
jgi:GntR family transcriptional regulator